MRPGDTPVPIPNTTVKTRAANGTALETVWESRWPPEQKKDKIRLRGDRSNPSQQGNAVRDRTGFTSDPSAEGVQRSDG